MLYGQSHARPYAPAGGAGLLPPGASIMGANSGPTVDALVDAMRAERRLLDELIAIMRRQRGAVSRDDLQAVDDSVFSTHRVLVTLNEARRRRRALHQMVANRDDASIHDLESVLGHRMTEVVRDARDGLRDTAQALAQEVAINRHVLREALSAGDQYVRTLTGQPATDAAPVYGTGSMPESRPAAGGLLVNRRV
jgi:hypothetical protein